MTSIGQRGHDATLKSVQNGVSKVCDGGVSPCGTLGGKVLYTKIIEPSLRTHGMRYHLASFGQPLRKLRMLSCAKVLHMRSRSLLPRLQLKKRSSTRVLQERDVFTHSMSSLASFGQASAINNQCYCIQGLYNSQCSMMALCCHH